MAARSGGAADPPTADSVDKPPSAVAALGVINLTVPPRTLRRSGPRALEKLELVRACTIV